MLGYNFGTLSDYFLLHIGEPLREYSAEYVFESDSTESSDTGASSSSGKWVLKDDVDIEQSLIEDFEVIPLLIPEGTIINSVNENDQINMSTMQDKSTAPNSGLLFFIGEHNNILTLNISSKQSQKLLTSLVDEIFNTISSNMSQYFCIFTICIGRHFYKKVICTHKSRSERAHTDEVIYNFTFNIAPFFHKQQKAQQQTISNNGAAENSSKDITDIY